jgi:ATP-binding cassette subfamily F protein uup
MLTGKLKPDTGEILPGVTTKYGYFTQEAITLNPNHRVIEEVKAIAEYITMGDGSQLSASKFLETFLFTPEKQYNFIEKLSGGEKKRLQLLKLLVTSPNFLILDEPTNDFDIDTLNVLEDFLINFKGCLLLVSHDRYFMDHLVDQLFVFEGDGKIRLFNGNYSDYRNWADGQETEEEPLKEVKPVAQPSTEKRKPSNKEKIEFSQLQSDIEKLEKQKEEINALLNSGSTDHSQLTAWGVQLEQIASQLDNKTERWLELSVLME